MCMFRDSTDLLGNSASCGCGVGSWGNRVELMVENFRTTLKVVVETLRHLSKWLLWCEPITLAVATYFLSFRCIFS